MPRQTQNIKKFYKKQEKQPSRAEAEAQAELKWAKETLDALYESHEDLKQRTKVLEEELSETRQNYVAAKHLLEAALEYIQQVERERNELLTLIDLNNW